MKGKNQESEKTSNKSSIELEDNSQEVIDNNEIIKSDVSIENNPKKETRKVNNDEFQESETKEDVSENNNEKIQNINDQIQEIYNFVKSLKDDIIIRNERDKYKDEAIQRMTKQIYAFEKDIFETIKKELILELISFFDTFLNFKRKFENYEDKTLQNEIDFLETEISNILFNNGIDEIDENIGDEINRDYHKIKNKIETDNIEEDKKIKEISKKGFIWNGKILRKQEVIVAEYKEKEKENVNTNE